MSVFCVVTVFSQKVSSFFFFFLFFLFLFLSLPDSFLSFLSYFQTCMFWKNVVTFSV